MRGFVEEVQAALPHPINAVLAPNSLFHNAWPG